MDLLLLVYVLIQHCFKHFFSFYILLPNIAQYNFADDNAFSSIAKSVDSLVKIIESESNCAIDYFHENKMIVKMLGVHMDDKI